MGYVWSSHRIEQTLVNVFVGRQPANYDRLFDYSRAVTGTLFLGPSATFLENVATAAPVNRPPVRGPCEGGTEAAASRRRSTDGAAGIGSVG